MRIFFALLVAISASILGCASSGVVSTGPDSYMIAKSEWGFTSGTDQKAELLRKANDYCKALGRRMEVDFTNQNDLAFRKTAGAEVYFRCVSPGGQPQK